MSGCFDLVRLPCPSISFEMCGSRCPDSPHQYSTIIAGYVFGLIKAECDILDCFTFIALELIYRHQ
jgi:hypothetical protein